MVSTGGTEGEASPKTIVEDDAEDEITAEATGLALPEDPILTFSPSLITLEAFFEETSAFLTFEADGAVFLAGRDLPAWTATGLLDDFFSWALTSPTALNLRNTFLAIFSTKPFLIVFLANVSPSVAS
jgi:hypothetical protein